MWLHESIQEHTDLYKDILSLYPEPPRKSEYSMEVNNGYSIDSEESKKSPNSSSKNPN